MVSFVNVFGRLKVLPEDFVVEEVGEKWRCSVPEVFVPNTSVDVGVLDVDLRKDFVWCELVKRDIDHFQALKQVSFLLGCSTRDLGYAGTKDRVAVTSQRLSLYKPDLEKLGKFSHDRLIIKNCKWAKRKIRLGYLDANHFRIVVRDVDKKDAMKVANRIKKTSFFPNFFGSQRFGSIRGNNVEIGMLLLKQKFEEAVWLILTQDSEHERDEVRKARRKLRESKDVKQALTFFPKYLRLELQLLKHLARKPDDFVGALRFGERKNILLFVNAVQSLVFNQVVSSALDEGLDFTKKGQLNGILVGYKMNFSSGRLGVLERDVLSSLGLSREDFDIRPLPFLRIKGGYRRALTHVEDLSISVEDDERFQGNKKIVLAFTLPSGVYATTFLENFFTFE